MCENKTSILLIWRKVSIYIPNFTIIIREGGFREIRLHILDKLIILC